MGFVIDTGIEGLGLERRRESYYIYSLGTICNNDIFLYPDVEFPDKSPSSGTIEMSKIFLKNLIKYFNEHPEELNEVNERASSQD
jgi:hypothetical protein